MVGERRPLSIKVQTSSGGAVSSEAVESRADRDGARDQRLETWLPGGRGGRNPGQL